MLLKRMSFCDWLATLAKYLQALSIKAIFIFHMVGLGVGGGGGCTVNVGHIFFRIIVNWFIKAGWPEPSLLAFCIRVFLLACASYKWIPCKKSTPDTTALISVCAVYCPHIHLYLIRILYCMNLYEDQVRFYFLSIWKCCRCSHIVYSDCQKKQRPDT